MPFYQQRGRVPRKRHIAFRREDGGIHYEELIGNRGFKGASSLLYHLHRPTQMTQAEVYRDLHWESAPMRALVPRRFRLAGVEKGGDPFLDRTPIAFNGDVALSTVRPNELYDGFYRNGQGDEIVYVVAGEGVLETALGPLAFGAGDYVVIPRGFVHRYRFTGGEPWLFVIESGTPVRIPSRYRNENGQLLEGAPFSERDIRTPGAIETVDEIGEFAILTKQRNLVTRHLVKAHPFDVVGWDGTYFPWAFNIRDFEAIVGRIHQPPPVHQTFEGTGFVVCSFVPRLFDFDPEAVPAPYHHSNVQSDEVLFYASAEFMSRKGIEFGSLTLHPDGIPHGPHPGKAEESIGVKETNELAVMVDTFHPLRVANAVLPVEDGDYARSWLE